MKASYKPIRYEIHYLDFKTGKMHETVGDRETMRAIDKKDDCIIVKIRRIKDGEDD